MQGGAEEYCCGARSLERIERVGLEGAGGRVVWSLLGGAQDTHAILPPAIAVPWLCSRLRGRVALMATAR